MAKIQIKVLTSGVPGHRVGDTVYVETDSNGVPIQKFWRRRFQDAKTDNCIEKVKPVPTKAPKNSKSTSLGETSK